MKSFGVNFNYCSDFYVFHKAILCVNAFLSKSLLTNFLLVYILPPPSQMFFTNLKPSLIMNCCLQFTCLNICKCRLELFVISKFGVPRNWFWNVGYRC